MLRELLQLKYLICFNTASGSKSCKYLLQILPIHLSTKTLQVRTGRNLLHWESELNTIKTWMTFILMKGEAANRKEYFTHHNRQKSFTMCSGYDRGFYRKSCLESIFSATNVRDKLVSDSLSL